MSEDLTVQQPTREPEQYAPRTDLRATLIDLQEQVVWVFMYNPEDKQFSREAKYAEAPTAATSLPSQQYLYTTGRTLKLTNLLLLGWCQNQPIRSLLNNLQALMVVDAEPSSPQNSTEEGQTATPTAFSPKLVRFAWGSERFGPAVVTAVSWRETAWLGGEPADATVDLTLLEVPDPDTYPKQQAAIEQATAEAAESAEVNLTDRQREDARKAAGEWLNNNSNLDKLPPAVREAVKAKRYSWLTNVQGEVRIVPSGGEALLIGTYDGETFTETEAENG